MRKVKKILRLMFRGQKGDTRGEFKFVGCTWRG